ncbi:MAG: ExbD/TolR family protein [Erythrobacter sp.]|uniref:ExbD/TolR family protein n=1 Tax=Erythrobacter sp. TaxID=1042 RepID=UPI003A8B349B
MIHANTARRSRFAEAYDRRNRRHRSGAMGEMNVTPFIDVLLVLLIMLIMAIPIKVHETTIDLPSSQPCLTCTMNLDENTVAITAEDQLLWNGVAVTREQLSSQTSTAAALPEEPLLRFEPAALASYDASAQTIVLIKEAGAKRFAFIGNHKYAQLD